MTTEATTATATAKPKTEVTTVTMLDGRVVEFAGNRKLLKEDVTGADGTVRVRLDFRNGESRVVTLRSELLLKAAAHGLSQKLGDEVAGLKGQNGAPVDIDDMVEAIDELKDRLDKGEWNMARAEGVAGTSVLLRALMEVSGQPRETVRAFLGNCSPKEKIALREIDPVVSPVVKRMEDEKAKKAGAGTDTAALLGKLTATA